MRDKEKILIITNIPNPYRIPLFNELNSQLKTQNISLKVVFGALGYSRRKWEIDMNQCLFDYEVLSSWKLNSKNSEGQLFTYKGLLNLIKKTKPSVIITSSFSPATIKLWLMSFFSSPPYIIWSGSINTKGRKDSLLRRLQRKLLVKRAAGFIAYGTKAKEYLISLGADSEKIKISFNTTDVDYFETETKRVKEEIERKEKKKNLLYIGHIAAGKRLDLLIYAVKRLLNKRNDFVLKVVGSGAEMEKMKILTNELGIDNYVDFEGFKQKADIPLYLAQADCFLFPSDYDIWGLALVEAMSAGIPCISSIHAGATHDLIKDGITGFVVDFSDSQAVVQKINWIFENPEQAREIGGNASRFVIEKLTLKKSATSFIQILEEL